MNRGAEKKRRRTLKAVSDYFNIPAQIAAGDARLTLTGCRQLMIENHRGILEYTSSLIRVDCGKFTAEITGEDLELGAMNRRDMAVVGKIRGIQIGDE